MNGFMRLSLAAFFLFAVACSTAPTSDDGSEPAPDVPSSAPADSSAGSGSEFSEFDSPSAGSDASAPAAGSEASPEASIEKEMAGSQQAAAAPDATPAPAAPEQDALSLDAPASPPAEAAAAATPPAGQDEFAEFGEAPENGTPEAPKVESGLQADNAPAPDMTPTPETPAPTPDATAPVAEAPLPEMIPQPNQVETPPNETPAPETPAAETPVQAQGPSDTSGLVAITDIQYRANDNGGTVVIEGAGPLTFNQRMNADTRQFVIEIPNSKLPRKLKRPFNTRDFAGTIGSIDAYQGRQSTTARIVVQLRPGAPEPVVQAEGNHLFVVAQPPTDQAGDTADGAKPTDALPSKLMASENIEEFLASNQNFYGKRISIETDDAEIRDVFRLISEESNVNLIISDEVKGKINLRLKNVPWDQALVMIMKAKKLGYTRVGNVLRIAVLADIKAEEEDALKFVAARKANATFKVRTVQVNYAKVEDLEKQIKPLLSPKGSVVSDPRTSSVVITDQDENMERAEKLVRALDVAPQQVLIEGKIVEAQDNFQRSIGVDWNAGGRTTQIKGARSSTGGLNALTGFGVNPGQLGSSSFNMHFQLGTLDILGDLTASLQLYENQGLVKVISSPRIVTLHNEPAEINQATELPITTSTIAANGTPIPSVSYKAVKMRLSVTPQITNDGAIIMGVDVSREIAGATNTTNGSFPVNSRAAKTKVIVKSTQTAVIGGIYQNDTTDNETRVPGLGSIPVVGWLFKNSTKIKNRTELLIFLTPRILGRLEGAPSALPKDDGGLEL